MATTFDLSVIFRAIDKLSVPMAQMQKKLDRFSKKAEMISKTLTNVGKKMTTFVTLPIVGLGTAMVRTAGQFEQYQASFEVLLGSAEKGQKLFQDITAMSAKTPFQLTDLSRSAKMMLNFGIELEDILPNLQMLGDIAGNDREKLRALSLAFAQSQSAGRLMGQDLLQMINAGFNPLQIISEQTGKSMAELKDEMSKGAISAEMVAEAFKIATAEGGRFYNNMEKQSKTFFGKWSTMMDNLKLMLKSFGDILLPIMIKVVEKITKMAKWFSSLDPRIKKIILIVLALVAAIGPLVFIIGKLIGVVSMAGKIFKAFSMLLTPQGLIIAAIAAAIIGLIIVIMNWGKITAWMSKQWKKFVNFIQRMPRIVLILITAFLPFIGLPLLIIRNWKKLKSFFVNIVKFIWNLLDSKFVQGIVTLLMPFIGLPIMIIKNWELVKDFFTKLWEGIVNAFVKAVEKIKEIWGDFSSWAMKNPVLKWLFETKPAKQKEKLEEETKKEERKEKKKEEEKEKKKRKSLLDMESMFKNLKGGMAEKQAVFVNVKVTAENGALATVGDVKSTGKVKKKVQSDSNYTGRSY